MVKIDISNRTFILIGVLLVIVIFGGIVIAGNPAVFGHGLDQVNMPACAVGEALVKNSTGWGCGGSASNNPDYDSEWVYVTSTAGVKDFTHSLGVVPQQVVLMECGAISGTTCTTKIVYMGAKGYSDDPIFVNPVLMTVDSSKISVHIYGGLGDKWVWGYWMPPSAGAASCPSTGGYYGWRCDGDADCDCTTGYYKILAWK